MDSSFKVPQASTFREEERSRRQGRVRGFRERQGEVSFWDSGAAISREQGRENRRSAKKRISAKTAARKHDIFQAEGGCRRHGKWRKLKMELETLETGDEGRDYKVETDERRREDGGGMGVPMTNT